MVSPCMYVMQRKVEDGEEPANEASVMVNNEDESGGVSRSRSGSGCVGSEWLDSNSIKGLPGGEGGSE